MQSGFYWPERLEVALALLRRSALAVSEEAWERAAISNAYYAAFIQARNALIAEGVAVPRADAHWFVIDHFTNSPQGKRKRIGQLLDRMRRVRNEADYDNVRRDTESKADTMLSQARMVLDQLERL